MTTALVTDASTGPGHELPGLFAADGIAGFKALVSGHFRGAPLIQCRANSAVRASDVVCGNHNA